MSENQQHIADQISPMINKSSILKLEFIIKSYIAFLFATAYFNQTESKCNFTPASFINHILKPELATHKHMVITIPRFICYNEINSKDNLHENGQKIFYSYLQPFENDFNNENPTHSIFSNISKDEDYMGIALNLAQNAKGRTRPNPLVGCCIVDPNGKIIGQGYHQYAGEYHAEVNAISQFLIYSNNDLKSSFLDFVYLKKVEIEGRKDMRLLECINEFFGNDISYDLRSYFKNCTLYVTLEPCNHYGKTPPCSNLIIKSGFGRVVIGIEDLNPLVSGKGILNLKQNGVKVRSRILLKDSFLTNISFFKNINKIKTKSSKISSNIEFPFGIINILDHFKTENDLTSYNQFELCANKSPIQDNNNDNIELEPSINWGSLLLEEHSQNIEKNYDAILLDVRTHSLQIINQIIEKINNRDSFTLHALLFKSKIDSAAPDTSNRNIDFKKLNLENFYVKLVNNPEYNLLFLMNRKDIETIKRFEKHHRSSLQDFQSSITGLESGRKQADSATQYIMKIANFLQLIGMNELNYIIFDKYIIMNLIAEKLFNQINGPNNLICNTPGFITSLFKYTKNSKQKLRFITDKNMKYRYPRLIS